MRFIVLLFVRIHCKFSETTGVHTFRVTVSSHWCQFEQNDWLRLTTTTKKKRKQNKRNKKRETGEEDVDREERNIEKHVDNVTTVDRAPFSPSFGLAKVYIYTFVSRTPQRSESIHQPTTINSYRQYFNIIIQYSHSQRSMHLNTHTRGHKIKKEKKKKA